MENNKLTNVQKRIASIMLANDNIDEYEISDVIISFGYLLKKENIDTVKELIVRYSDEIHSRLNDYLYEKDDIIEDIYCLVDSIKSIKNKSDKGSEERKIIREELNKLKNLCNIYSTKINTNNNESQTEAYYKILSILLLNESNYDKIEELLKRKNKICNLRYNDRHIVVDILDLYIINLIKMIKDKNSDYINPTYLKNVYYLFTKNPCCRLTNEDKLEIINMINEMNVYISSSLKSKKRRRKAHKELNSLRPNKYFNDNDIIEEKKYSDDYLAHFSIDLRNNLKYIIKDDNFEEVFLCHNQPYKIEPKKDGTIKLTAYAINYEPLISEKSLIQEYFEYSELKQKNVDDFFHSTLHPKLNNIYPAIAYELTFYPSGKIKSLNVKQCNMKVVEENKILTNSENMIALNDLYKKSIIKNGGLYTSYDLGSWNEHFENVLEQEYIKFLNSARLPFIYHGYSKFDKDLAEKNMNELNSYFSCLSKSDSYEIANILFSNTDRMHYSVLPIDDAVYDLRLLDPISYLGIENQRMLNNLYFNCRKYEHKERLHRLKLSTLYKYIENVDELNKNINYVGITQKFSKGKIKNLIRI